MPRLNLQKLRRHEKILKNRNRNSTRIKLVGIRTKRTGGGVEKRGNFWSWTTSFLLSHFVRTEILIWKFSFAKVCQFFGLKNRVNVEKLFFFFLISTLNMFLVSVFPSKLFELLCTCLKHVSYVFTLKEYSIAVIINISLLKFL